MSAGPFVNAFYESETEGEVLGVRVQPETLTLTVGGVSNADPGGPATQKVGALVGGSRRRRGIHTRRVRVIFTTTPDGYKVGGVCSYPVLNQALWEQLNSAPNQSGTVNIGGTAYACDVVGTTPQYNRLL